MIIDGIDTKDISVVVQGAVDDITTPKCMASIRTYLPGAEIVLSTWEGSDVSKLDYDVLIMSKDPGILTFNFVVGRVIPVNSNRQLLSTQVGLKRVQKKYALKIRTDFYLSSAQFLYYFHRYEKRDSNHKYFNERVIISSIFARRFSSENGFPMPYHASDFFFFGLADDVKDFFMETPIEEQNEKWHYKLPDRKCYSNMTGRYAPEQYYCIEWIRRHGEEVEFDDFTDWSMEKLAHSDKILFNNFIFLDPVQIGLRSDKHDFSLSNETVHYGIINNALFEHEYKRRYDKSFLAVQKHGGGYCRPIFRMIAKKDATAS